MWGTRSTSAAQTIYLNWTFPGKVVDGIERKLILLPKCILSVEEHKGLTYPCNDVVINTAEFIIGTLSIIYNSKILFTSIIWITSIGPLNPIVMHIPSTPRIHTNCVSMTIYIPRRRTSRLGCNCSITSYGPSLDDVMVHSYIGNSSSDLNTILSRIFDDIIIHFHTLQLRLCPCFA